MRHREEPAAKGIRTHAVSMTQRLHEGLLHRIFGLVMVLEDPEEETKNRAFVPLEERVESRIVSGLEPGQQSGISRVAHLVVLVVVIFIVVVVFFSFSFVLLDAGIGLLESVLHLGVLK